jgi:hypothetical protein
MRAERHLSALRYLTEPLVQLGRGEDSSLESYTSLLLVVIDALGLEER